MDTCEKTSLESIENLSAIFGRFFKKKKSGVSITTNLFFYVGVAQFQGSWEQSDGHRDIQTTELSCLAFADSIGRNQRLFLVTCDTPPPHPHRF